MRARAFRPEVPGCLEDRRLLSGVVGAPEHQVVLLRRKINQITQQIQSAFMGFNRDGDVSILLADISDFVVMVPYGRVDGLGVQINNIVAAMRYNVAHHVPNAVGVAYNQVQTATKMAMQVRVRAGDVVVR